MEIVPIEESALDTATDGLYEVLREGQPVKKVEDFYDATHDQWLKKVPVRLVARVGDMGPHGLPAGVDHAEIRPDWKMLIKTFALERNQ